MSISTSHELLRVLATIFHDLGFEPLMLSPKVLKWEAYGQVSNYGSITDSSSRQECLGNPIASTSNKGHRYLDSVWTDHLERRYQLGHDATDPTNLNYNAKDSIYTFHYKCKKKKFNNEWKNILEGIKFKNNFFDNLEKCRKKNSQIYWDVYKKIVPFPK